MHKKRHPIILMLNILIFFFTLLFSNTNILTFSIKTASPLLILPLLTAFAIYHSPLSSALTGLVCGIFMDTVAADSYCFNAILLLVIGGFASFAANNLFNKNIQSAVVLSLINCVFYFVLLWLFFHTNNVSITDSAIYLLRYSLPSAVLSAIFILPLYYVYKHFNKITSE